MRADSIIIAPILTEKTTAMREANKFAFRVDPRANKIQIAKAVEELFGVKVLGCNVLKVYRKPKRQRIEAATECRGDTAERNSRMKHSCDPPQPRSSTVDERAVDSNL